MCNNEWNRLQLKFNFIARTIKIILTNMFRTDNCIFGRKQFVILTTQFVPFHLYKTLIIKQHIICINKTCARQ